MVFFGVFVVELGPISPSHLETMYSLSVFVLQQRSAKF